MRTVAVLSVLAVLCLCHKGASSDTLKKKTMVSWGKEKISHLQFYFHDIVQGENVTTVDISNGSPLSSFGLVRVIDDPLTEGPDPDSTVLGYAQGVYSGACRREVRFLMAVTFVFEYGKYEGSSLSMLGNNGVLHSVREMPIVGGSGLFRFARGYAQVHTHYLDFKTGNAVVQFNVTVLHY